MPVFTSAGSTSPSPLPAIQTDLGWDVGTVGLIGGIFLWVYALGQLVNGTLGQRANARWFVGLGMLVSAPATWPLAGPARCG